MAVGGVDLWAPFEVDRLLEVRTSKMKIMQGLNVETGIDKKLCPGEMKVGKLGLEGDEHDPTFHGGIDKAILGYCSSHYADWQSDYPDRKDRFVPGGFGENFVTAHMNERNVCIGDVISVGNSVLLQVSLPRMPCYKLNHRFSLKQFAPETYKTSRTGWYYRVLREGTVKAGDELRLVERKWPQWTVERLQEYLHRDVGNDEMNLQISLIEALGKESRGQFEKRVAKAKRKAEVERRKKEEEAAGEGEQGSSGWREFEILSKNKQTDSVVSVVLRAMEPLAEEDAVEEFPSKAAHAKIRLPNGLLRSYSIVSAGPDGRANTAVNHFELGVKLEENSRGGSRWFHEARVGDKLEVGRITTSLKFQSGASAHHFIVGGIGVTAFLSLLRSLRNDNITYVVHYAVRSAEQLPFRDRLEPFWEHVVVYDKAKGERMDIPGIVEGLGWNCQLYVCGPGGMMDAAKGAVEASGFSEEDVHYEAFKADTSGDPFEVEVMTAKSEGGSAGGAGSRKVLKVGEEETLLDVLRKEFEVPSSCEVGNCGTCKVTVKDGRVEHRGTALSAEEKAAGVMLSCVSRGIGRIAIEV